MFHGIDGLDYFGQIECMGTQIQAIIKEKAEKDEVTSGENGRRKYAKLRKYSQNIPVLSCSREIPPLF